MLFGRGFGSSYDLDSQYLFSNVSSELYRGEYFDRVIMGVWQKPDTTWVPMLHDGGLVLLIGFLTVCWQGMRSGWALAVSVRADQHERRANVWMLLMLCLWLIPSIFGNILFIRFVCGVMGIVLALIYGLHRNVLISRSGVHARKT